MISKTLVMESKIVECNRNNLVTVAGCKTYNPAALKDALHKCLVPLGGIKNFVKPGQKVALKPNILKASAPEEAVITHPVFVQAVAEMVMQAEGIPFVIDSPGTGFPYSSQTLRKIYQRCGYTELMPPVTLNFDCRFSEVSFPEGKKLKRFEILSPILEAEVIINLPKVKTHSFTFLTCGVKNIFGVVPGIYKVAYHGRFQDAESFSCMLIDLCQLIKPHLTICDGIIAMEGDGPAGGERKELGIVSASRSPFLLDRVVSHLIGFDPLQIPCLRMAIEDGLCPKEIEQIHLISDEQIDQIKVQFKSPGSFITTSFSSRLKRFIIFRFLCASCKNLLSVKPVIDKDLCKGCGICAESCPKKAIRIVDHRAMIHYNECIRCYCCHELCPYKGVHLQKPLLYQAIMKLLPSE